VADVTGPSRKHRGFGFWFAYAWVALASLAIAWTVNRVADEPKRIQEAIVEDQGRQARELARLRAEQERAQRNLCVRWKQEAGVDVLPSTSDLGRIIIRTAAAGYVLTGCADVTGPLGPVDPDAYVVAPTRPEDR